MRKLVLSLAAAGAALAVASPAAAQYYPQPHPNGTTTAMATSYLTAMGPDNYGRVGSLQTRIDAVSSARSAGLIAAT